VRKAFGILLSVVLVVGLGLMTAVPVLADASPGWSDIDGVAAGHRHTVGLESDGTVVAVGSNSSGVPDVGGWLNIKQVAAGGYHTVGAKNDGTVVAVGQNSNGQCNVGNWTGIKQVAGGGWHTVGVKNNGTVVAAGDNNQGQCNVNNWTGINQTAAGGLYTVGLKSAGTVVAVGDNFYGQCNVTSWTNITQVAAGYRHTVGLKADGTVVAVGDNLYGQCNVTGWTNIIRVSAGYYHSAGLCSNGTVVAVGNNLYGQCNVTGWRNITQVAAGYYHTVGVRSSGTVLAVGNNEFGQCGSGKTQTVTNGTVDARAEADTEVAVTGTATVTVFEYDGNPHPGAPILYALSSLEPLADEWAQLNKWVDVKAEDIEPGTAMNITVHYTDAEVTNAKLNESSLRLLWYNGSAWAQCSIGGVNTTNEGIYSGYIWATVNASTTPSLSDMGETPFGGYGHPTPTPPGGCFVATAAYGTDTAKELGILREFRDEVLSPNTLGAKLISIYYKTSPPIANFISQHEFLRTVVRVSLVDPIVKILRWTHNLWSMPNS